MSRQIIENTVIQLLDRERFYAEMLLRMRVQERSGPWEPPSPKHPKGRWGFTAGVNVKNGDVNFYVGREFWAQLNAEQRVGVLKHECLHPLHEHFGRGKLSENWNIATDCAINQLIPEVSTIPNLVTVESLAKALKLDVAKVGRNQNAEYYMALIEEHGEPGGSGAEGSILDDHDIWAEGDQGEAAKAAIQDLVAKAQRGAGNVPSELRQIIDRLLSRTLNWRTILRRFVANAEEVVTTSTRHRRNRRYGILYPGYRSEPLLNVVVCTDSSGSVGDDEYAAFCSEIDAISKTGATITWIQADCEVQKVEKWKRGTAKQRSGYGGTAYSPALDKAKELGADAIVYFGDMDAADTPNNPGIPVLWATVRGGKPPASFGGVIEVTK